MNGSTQETKMNKDNSNNALTEVRKVYGNATAATNTYHAIHNLINGHKEE